MENTHKLGKIFIHQTTGKMYHKVSPDFYPTLGFSDKTKRSARFMEQMTNNIGVINRDAIILPVEDMIDIDEKEKEQRKLLELNAEKQ